MLEIRPVSEADMDALLALKTSLQALHVARRPDVFKPMKPADIDAWLREQLADEATETWVAEEGGRAIGYVMAIRRQRDDTAFALARRWCEINEVAVDPGCRRRGVGRALLEHAVEQARQSGIDAVELSTWAFNEAARTAFARMGFEPMVVRYEISCAS